MAHFLVTGGAGFIGSHLAEELVGADIASASPTTRHRQAPQSRSPQRRRVPRRRSRRSGVRAQGGRRRRLRAAPGGDPVRAAVGGRSADVASRQHRRNAERAPRGARRRRQSPGLRRLVVGVRRHGDAAQSAREMPSDPLSPYALQKLVGEQYLQMFTRLYGLETVTTRYFNVFGPRQDPSSPYSGVISLFATALLEGRGADHLRRRRADARLHLRRQRRRRRAARRRSAQRSGEVINVAAGGAHLARTGCSRR